MSFIIVASIGAIGTIGASAIGANQQKQLAKGASNEANALRNQIKLLEEERNKTIPVINPYENAEDLSFMIENFSDQFSNPFENLGVATKAAELQIQETDKALANTLDLLASTGASAGGATALARAAAESKKSVSATIEQQEAQNEILRAKGESQLQANQIAEQVRVQSALFGEATRQQQLDAEGKLFVYREKDNRMMEQLDRKQAQLTGQQQRQQTASNNAVNIMGQGISAGAQVFSSGINAYASNNNQTQQGNLSSNQDYYTRMFSDMAAQTPKSQ